MTSPETTSLACSDCWRTTQPATCATRPTCSPWWLAARSSSEVLTARQRRVRLVLLFRALAEQDAGASARRLARHSDSSRPRPRRLCAPVRRGLAAVLDASWGGTAPRRPLLVVSLMAISDDGSPGGEPFTRHLGAERNAMLAAGAISADQDACMTLPTLGRSRNDLLAPFGDGRFAGLAVEYLDVVLASDPIWERFKGSGDAADFGARWAKMLPNEHWHPRSLLRSTPIYAPRSSTDWRLGLAARLAAEPEPMRMWLGRVVPPCEGGLNRSNPRTTAPLGFGCSRHTSNCRTFAATNVCGWARSCPY